MFAMSSSVFSYTDRCAVLAVGPHVLFCVWQNPHSLSWMKPWFQVRPQRPLSYAQALKILQGNCARMLLPSLGHPTEIVLCEEYKENASVLRDAILFPATQRSSKQRKGGNSCVLQPEHYE